MAKKGMKRPDRTHTQPRNQQKPVPEIQGKAKHTKEKAGPIDNGVGASGQTAFHRGRPIPQMPIPPLTRIWRGTTSKTISPQQTCQSYHNAAHRAAFFNGGNV